jgi:branched-chain amino acid transport system permease protein
MESLISVIVIGLLVGCLYALVSVGLTLTYGVLRVVNFAHGEFMMIGMYAVYLLQQNLGLDPYLSWPIATVVVMALAAIAYVFVIKPTVESAHVVQGFVTLGLSLVLQNVAQVLFSSHIVNTSSFLGEQSATLGFLQLPYTYVASAGAAVVVTLLLWIWLQRTDLGKAVRATAQNPVAARLQGINDNTVYLWTFVLGTGLAGLGGAIFSPIYSTYPTVGFGIMLVAFVVVVLGGMGSLPGAFLGALIIGVVEALTSYLIGPDARQVVYFLVFVGVLVLRPNGLFGIRGAELVGYR